MKQKLLALLIAILLLPLLAFSEDNTKQNEENSDIELILLVDAEYSFSHGYGHIFNCPVNEIRFGNLEDEIIRLSVWGNFGENLYNGYLEPFQRYENLVISFIRLDERPAALSGFADSNGNIWEILSVTQEE